MHYQKTLQFLQILQIAGKIICENGQERHHIMTILHPRTLTKGVFTLKQPNGAIKKQCKKCKNPHKCQEISPVPAGLLTLDRAGVSPSAIG